MTKKHILFEKLKKTRFKIKALTKKSVFFYKPNLIENNILDTKSQEEEIAERIDKTNMEVVQQKSKRKKILNLLFFLLNIAIVVCILVFQLSNSNVQGFDEIIKSGNFRVEYIIIILFSFVIIMFLETHRACYLLKNSPAKKSRPALCYKMNAVGKYYDCVTPLSTGGQPFQVFYLSKHGVDAGTSLSIPVARYVIFQIAWLSLGLFAIIYSLKCFNETTLVSVTSFLGFALDAGMIVGVWILSVGKIGKVLVIKCLRLLCKMKIIKSYEKTYGKVMDTVSGFQTTMKAYTKNIFAFIGLVLSQLGQIILQFSVPYFIYLLLGGTPSFDIFITIWVYSILVEFASGFVPIPGGTGMAEVAFTMVLTPIFPNGTVFWGLLFWRFMNYYIYLIQGIFIMIYDKIWGNKKFEWQKRKWELETESKAFTQQKLKEYKRRPKAK